MTCGNVTNRHQLALVKPPLIWRLSCVRVGSARYSVPTTAIGATVEVLAAHGRVRVLDPTTGDLLDEHTLVAPGEASIIDGHYGGPRPAPRRPVRPRTPAERPRV